jgi:hypothetical protein
VGFQNLHRVALRYRISQAVVKRHFAFSFPLFVAIRMITFHHVSQSPFSELRGPAMPMTPEQVQDYLLRSYTAVDGLWFVKIEEAFGFDAALDLDVKVWEVMPKIQARRIREALGAGRDAAGLRACYTEKLTLEEFGFTEADVPGGFEIRVHACPWFEKMKRSNRAHLAARVGNRICTAEYSGWASEFGCAFRFGGGKKICEEGAECVLAFASSQTIAGVGPRPAA